MRKIEGFNNCCDRWKPGRNVKGDLLTTRACWACYFSLFSRCWLDEYEKSDKLLIFALEGDETAKQILHDKLTRQ